MTDAPLRPTLPSKTCWRVTTSRPVRAVMWAATASRRWTNSPTLTAAMPRPCTASPVSAWGVTWPSSVVKAKSTTASSGKGLRTRRVSVASRVVTPSAKYQVGDADEAQGVMLAPNGPAVDSSTTASPPSSSTTAERWAAWITSARWRVARP